MTASPNCHSVGDIAEVRTWDVPTRTYVYKPVRLRRFTPRWIYFTFEQGGQWGSQEYEKVRRV